MEKDDNFLKIDRWVIDIILSNFFAKGVLNSADLQLPKKALYKKIFSFINENGLPIVTDHRDEILNQANNFLLSKKYEYAKVFYAMYFEHTLNALVENECHRRKIDDKTKIDIIRSIDIYGKLTWLPKIFGFKLFNTNHLKTIKTLADDRNAFVHYKWKPEEEDDDDDDSIQQRVQNDFLKKVRAAVRYMKQYESVILFKGSKSKIKKVTR